MSLCAAPFLLDHPKVRDMFPADAIDRARTLLSYVGSIGAYSDSRGAAGIRREVADFIEKRDGYVGVLPRPVQRLPQYSVEQLRHINSMDTVCVVIHSAVHVLECHVVGLNCTAMNRARTAMGDMHHATCDIRVMQSKGGLGNNFPDRRSVRGRQDGTQRSHPGSV
jgi:hypothetical protein